MLLEHKTALVRGGGGSVGSAAARAFAREGAGNVTVQRAGSDTGTGTTFTPPFAAPGPAVLYLTKAEAACGPELQ